MTEVTLKCGVFYAKAAFVDAKDLPLPNAPIYVTFANGSRTVAPLHSDADGELELERAPGGLYSFEVHWGGVVVNSTQISIQSNEDFKVRCQVYYDSFEVLDDQDIPLKGAFVIVAQANGSLALMTTNSSGFFSLNKVPVGRYNMKVLWQGVEVNSTHIDIDSNGLYSIRCRVFHLSVTVVDSLGKPLAGATVIVIPPNPLLLPQLVANVDKDGQLDLDQIASGRYSFRVIWRETIVNSTSLTISSSSSLLIKSQVYDLNVDVVDRDGSPIVDAHVLVRRAPSNVSYGIQLTDDSGRAYFPKTPRGDYFATVDYATTYLYTPVHISTSQSLRVDSNDVINIKLDEYPPPFYSTYLFIWVLIIAVFVAVIVFMFLKLRNYRRKVKT
ncbi:MAG: hypothetical protein GTN80_03800 [Nitrososphaeria archaeon]|nr:hypothetical protein [Nitrososphaeria archaeon]